MRLLATLLCCFSTTFFACSSTKSVSSDNSSHLDGAPPPHSVVAKDFYIAVDSIVVPFTDDPAHTITLHRHDVVHVEGSAEGGKYRVHIGEHYALIPTSAASEYDGTHVTTPPTGAGHTIQTGPRGGQYYINSKGKKTYVKKK